MLKKNGFISISIVYTFFLVFLMTLLFIISRYTDNRTLLKVVKNDIKEDLNIVINYYHNNCNDNTLACTVAKKYLNDNTLYFHDTTLDGSANDLSYRFSGNNPSNNYVCFGSDINPCPITNIYRIIGLFKINGAYQVKLIKSEYLKESEINLPKKATVTVNQGTTGLNSTPARVQNYTAVDYFAWSSTSGVNNWTLNNLNQRLNDRFFGFLSTIPENYQNLITDYPFIISGNVNTAIASQKASVAYANEVGQTRIKVNDLKCVNDGLVNVNCEEENLTSVAKIGLMYVSDYAYASSPANWNTALSGYGSELNKQNNWLYNGAYEYTISRNADNFNSYYHIDAWGYVGSFPLANVGSQAIRPVFYLNNNVKYISGDGSIASPYRVG